VFLLLVFHKFLEPDMRFALQMESFVRDPDVRDGFVAVPITRERRVCTVCCSATANGGL
jgi:hypothetical protein